MVKNIVRRHEQQEADMQEKCGSLLYMKHQCICLLTYTQGPWAQPTLALQ